MRKNQINIISFFFSTLLILPLLLVIFFQLWQYHLSETGTERMETESIQTITVKVEDVIWKEEGREVTIRGEYFDLVSWTLNNGTYTFTGVFDEEETAVNKLLEKQNFSENIIIRLLIIGQCFASLIFFLLNDFKFTGKQRKFQYFFTGYKFLFLKIIAPPPRRF